MSRKKRKILLTVVLTIVISLILILGFNFQSKLKSKPKPLVANPQFVIFSFDGGNDLNKWQESLDFAAAMKKTGKPIYFTYFLSGAYLLTEGESAIGFAASQSEIKQRLAYLKRALKEGHEIASHTVGHFDGGAWSQSEWEQELTAWQKLISFWWPKFKPLGFRAPNLSWNENLWPALKNSGYQYDSSKMIKTTQWPQKLTNGLWEFPLTVMDYNLYLEQTGAQDILKKGTPEWQNFYDQTLALFNYHFQQNYNHERAPLSFGLHFPSWNDGLYWAAAKAFAAAVCGLTDVYCVTYSELLKWLHD